MHTRDRILEAAADLFAIKGFHGTTVDEIAQAVAGSRALVYQYFPSKDAIFVDLAHECERVVLDHGRQLTDLGPDAAGMQRLRTWLHEWEHLYDRYATVFLEFPGIGPVSGRPQADADVLSARYTRLISERLRRASISGIAPDEAAAATLRLAHMTNLYRYRKLFDLPAGEVFSDSLAVAIQLLLFPETPPTVIAEVVADHPRSLTLPAEERPGADPHTVDAPSSITRQDILQASGELFTAHGYYAVGMPAICAAAAISRATLYRHFSTKMDILAELTTVAVDKGRTLSDELAELARRNPTPVDLHAWFSRYVGFRRRYGGVIRAWYDGTLREQLADQIARSVVPFRQAAFDLLQRVGLPERMDPAVATTVFLAVLARSSDIAVGSQRERTDDEAADFMMVVLRRCLLVDWEALHPTNE